MIERYDRLKEQHERRRSHFRQLGLCPYQVLLTVGASVFVLSVVAAAAYRFFAGYRDIIVLTMLVRPALIVILWLFQRSCYANSFAVVAACSAFMAFLSIATRRTDIFNMAAVISLCITSATACILWRKTRRDPIFAAEDKKADDRAA
jgi:hypothetical protein